MLKAVLHFLIVGSVLIGANNFAQADHHGMEGGGPGMEGPMMDHEGMLDENAGPMKKLNLTEEQKKKIKEIRTASKDALKTKMDAMKTAGDALRDAMKPETPKDEILAKFNTFQEKRNDMARAHMETMLAVREVLTVEQRKQWHEAHQGPGKGMMMKKGGRGRHGG